MKQIKCIKQKINVIWIVLIFAFVVSCNNSTENDPVVKNEKTIPELKTSDKKVLVATDYVIDKEKSSMEWYSALFGEDSHGTFDFTQGQIGMGGGEVLGGTFKIDLESVTSDAGLVDKIKSDDFFHVKAHPEAKLEILSVKPIADENWQAVDGLQPTHIVQAALTFRNIKKEIAFPAYIEINGDEVITKTNQLIIDPANWGFEQIETAENNSPSYSDKMRLAFTITANKV